MVLEVAQLDEPWPAFQVTAEAIAGEGMIVTAGGLDMHVPELRNTCAVAVCPGAVGH